MSLLQFSMKHMRTLSEAKVQLENVVADAQRNFGSMLTGVEWSGERDAVVLSGAGVKIDLRVDATDIHVTGDVPILGKILGQPMVASLKKAVEERFKQLPKPAGGKP